MGAERGIKTPTGKACPLGRRHKPLHGTRAVSSRGCKTQTVQELRAPPRVRSRLPDQVAGMIQHSDALAQWSPYRGGAQMRGRKSHLFRGMDRDTFVPHSQSVTHAERKLRWDVCMKKERAWGRFRTARAQRQLLR